MTKLPIIDASMEDQTIQKPAMRPKRDVTIQDAVITSLGRPPGLYRVAVLPIWQGHYRVNVLIGPDATSLRIPHSYFMVVGHDGGIISSSPPIVRLYP